MVPWTDARCALGQPRPCWPEPRAEVYPATPAGAGDVCRLLLLRNFGSRRDLEAQILREALFGGYASRSVSSFLALWLSAAQIAPQLTRLPSARCPPWRQPEVRRRRQRRLGCAAPAGRSLGRPRLGFRCRADELSVPLLELRAEERARPAAARRRLPAPLACAQMKRFEDSDLCLSPALHACKGHQNSHPETARVTKVGVQARF